MSATNGNRATPPVAPAELDGFKALADILGTYKRQLLEAGLTEADALALLVAAQTQFIVGLAPGGAHDRNATAPRAENA